MQKKKTFEYIRWMDWEDPSICYHSLRLSEHEYKRMGELDFVILCKHGLYVLEVKGGSVSRDEGGIWTIADRNLVRHRKRESPFEQASGGLYSLVKNIKEKFPDAPFLDMTIGYGVIFPDCTFNVATVEWAQEMIIDQRGVQSPSSFKNSFTRLVRYWENKKVDVYQLKAEDVALLAKFLRPKFDLAESLGHRADEIDRVMVTLTNQQYEKLDAIECNPRIVCSGGAGTGKTFLALDVAKRLSEDNRKTLFVCKSRVLAGYIRSRIDTAVHVRSFTEINPSESYDAIVVDEGQDVLNFEDLNVLDGVLARGLENGTWRIFLDKNNQKGLFGKFDESAWEMLSCYHPVQVSLSRNCRNTEPIVNSVRLLTASDIGTATAGGGPDVRYFYTSGEQESILKLEREIYRLLDDEVKPGEISLLSSGSIEDSIASKLDQKLRRRLTVLDHTNAAKFPFNNICFSTVEDFKGLESRFVFVIDFSVDLFECSDKVSLYVAMTRARAGLTLIVPDNIKPLINRTLIDNLQLIKTGNYSL